MYSPEHWCHLGPEWSRDKASPPASACCCGTEEERPVKQATAAHQRAVGPQFIFKMPPFVRLFFNQLSYYTSFFASLQLVKKKSLFCLIERFCAWFTRCRRCLVWPYHKLSHQYNHHPPISAAPPHSRPTPSRTRPVTVSLYGEQGSGMKRLPGKQGNCLGFKRAAFLCAEQWGVLLCQQAPRATNRAVWSVSASVQEAGTA